MIIYRILYSTENEKPYLYRGPTATIKLIIRVVLFFDVRGLA